MCFSEKVITFLVSFVRCPYLCIAFENNGRLAQLVQSVCLTSRGSGVRIPQRPRTIERWFLKGECFSKAIGRLAQLVQSVCLTSRGSGVRIPQRPPDFIFLPFQARLAQLVQSDCLTRRGSGVRIPQRPHHQKTEVQGSWSSFFIPESFSP